MRNQGRQDLIAREQERQKKIAQARAVRHTLNDEQKEAIDQKLQNSIKAESESGVMEALEGGAQIVSDARYADGTMNYDNNSLALAIKTENPKIVELILDANAPIVSDTRLADGTMNYDNNSLALAIKTENPKIVELILDANAPIVSYASDPLRNSLALAIKTEQPEIVKLILAEGARIVSDARYRDGTMNYDNNSLALAISTKNSEIVKLILAKGAQIVSDARFTDGEMNYDNNSLALAIKTENPEIVKLILDAGAPIVSDASDSLQNSLECAISTRNSEIFDLLLIYGADPNVLQNETKKAELLARKDNIQCERKNILRSLAIMASMTTHIEGELAYNSRYEKSFKTGELNIFISKILGRRREEIDSGRDDGLLLESAMQSAIQSATITSFSPPAGRMNRAGSPASAPTSPRGVSCLSLDKGHCAVS